MDIYERKSKLKFVLIAIAFLIALITLWYTNILAGKIAEKEKAQVRLWAEAISKEAALVKYNSELFARLAQDERKKVNLWADATNLALKAEDSDALTFATGIITENSEIPLIQTDQNRVIKTYRNVEYPGIEDSTLLRNDLLKEFGTYPPIQVYYEESVDYIYYKDSKLFTEIKIVLNDLTESFLAEVINSASVPVILTDDDDVVLNYGNIDTTKFKPGDDINSYFAAVKAQSEKIDIDLGDGKKKHIYFQNSRLLTQLKFYPLVLLGIIAIFLFVSYLAFSGARKAEQNQVWVGMAKETAHQLGTPISSLAAWIEYIKETPPDERASLNILPELEKDVNRLALVADRFSKIGSKPALTKMKVQEVLEQAIAYIRTRASNKVSFNLMMANEELTFRINKQLFDWVLENLLKNALDAMEGEGNIDIVVEDQDSQIMIDVTDSGKGIAKSKFETIFQPGYSTKQRGWGLGLSLTKRIVENYHSGKIFVRNSAINQGTTFRIQLPK